MSKLLSTHWLRYYNNIKAETWPEISCQEDLLNLPSNLLKEILFDHELFHEDQPEEPVLQHLSSYKQESNIIPNSTYFDQKNFLDFNEKFLAHNIEVHYHSQLNGGGTTFGQRYSHILSKLYPGRRFANCFEWCAGPAFIGFDLLSRNICENLYLSDIYKPCIESIKTTIEHNKHICQDRVHYCHGRCISDLPDDWKFDLVVGNPPHYDSRLPQLITKILPFNAQMPKDKRIYCDDQWKLHEEFFDHIRPHLAPHARILLVENTSGSDPSIFEPFIEKNGMRIVDSHWESHSIEFYFLEVACV